MKQLLAGTALAGLIVVLNLLLVTTGASGADLPLDQESAQLIAELAAEPGAIAKWIRLADVQRIMGYSRGARESLAKALSIAAIPKCEDSLRDALGYLQPANEGGAENRHRNVYWATLVRRHHQNGEFANYGEVNELHFSHIGRLRFPTACGASCCVGATMGMSSNRTAAGRMPSNSMRSVSVVRN